MTPRSKRARIHADLDEIAPNTFIIHNDKVRLVLRGEGVTIGHTFQLVSPRRFGLLGRLKMRGFNVRTLTSRFERLPALPPAPQLGETLYRDHNPRERWSSFDLDYLRWQDIVPITKDDQQVLPLQAGQIIRRRRSRTGGDFFQIEAAKNAGINLLPLSATEAILRGYAQATQDSDIEIDVVAHPDDAYLLPLDFVLPASYLDMLKCTGKLTPEGLLIDAAGWSFALRTFHRLNLRPSLGDAEVEVDTWKEDSAYIDNAWDDDDEWDDE